MLGLLGWFYMGVPRCIQEDSLPKEPTLLKDKSQVHHNEEHVYRMVKNIRVVYGKKNPDGMNRDRSTPRVEGVPFKK